MSEVSERIDKKLLDKKHLCIATGVYMDSVFLKLYKLSWANKSADPLSAASRIFFSVWINDQSIRERKILYNIHALKLRQISAGGDNSAEMELNAAGNVNFDMGRYGIEFVASPRHADGIVITGPVSNSMAEALQICYDAMPSPKLIILAGTDAISGGIFNGSMAINREFIDSNSVDLYIPGNPPHPLTFINGILDLIGSK